MLGQGSRYKWTAQLSNSFNTLHSDLKNHPPQMVSQTSLPRHNRVCATPRPQVLWQEPRLSLFCDCVTHIPALVTRAQALHCPQGMWRYVQQRLAFTGSLSKTTLGKTILTPRVMISSSTKQGWVVATPRPESERKKRKQGQLWTTQHMTRRCGGADPKGHRRTVQKGCSPSQGVSFISHETLLCVTHMWCAKLCKRVYLLIGNTVERTQI